MALITPMRRAGRAWVIDHDRLFSLIDDVIDAGVAGVLLAGTTGQGATMTHDEQVDLVIRGAEHARRRATDRGRRVLILANAGSNATHEALSLTRRIGEAVEVDAFLHVTGYYNNPPQDGLRRHFEAVAEAALQVGAPIILYNIPGRTASRLEAGTIVQLAEHPGIVGIKDASGDLEAIRQVIERTDRRSFAVLSGEDHLVHDIIRLGGVGVISASANRWPREFQRLTELALAGRWEESERLQRALQPCVDAVFAVKNPIPLAHMFNTGVRLPLVGADELAEPLRSRVLEKIARALSIAEFPLADEIELAGRGGRGR